MPRQGPSDPLDHCGCLSWNAPLAREGICTAYSFLPTALFRRVTSWPAGQARGRAKSSHSVSPSISSGCALHSISMDAFEPRIAVLLLVLLQTLLTDPKGQRDCLQFANAANYATQEALVRPRPPAEGHKSEHIRKKDVRPPATPSDRAVRTQSTNLAITAEWRHHAAGSAWGQRPNTSAPSTSRGGLVSMSFAHSLVPASAREEP